ncbi:MAG: glycosyltransferase family 2 protein [Promethearchaeota archaeon]
MTTSAFTIETINEVFQKHAKERNIELPRVKVIIPVYNEEKSIENVVKRTCNVLSKMHLEHEILVIDDGSSDCTGEILGCLDVACAPNDKNRGKGYTIQKGFALAREDEYIVTIDGDGEHAPEDLPALLFPVLMNKADCVIGSRFTRYKNLEKGSYLNNQKRLSHLRKFGNWLFSTFMWFFTRRSIKDSQSGYRVFAPGIVKKLDIRSHGFMVETEITLQLIKQGYRVVEVPIHNGNPLRGSYMNILNDSVKIVLTIFRESFPKKVTPLIDGLIKKFN